MINVVDGMARNLMARGANSGDLAQSMLNESALSVSYQGVIKTMEIYAEQMKQVSEVLAKLSC
ncbi:MAG: hypothetical protein HQM07_06565 [Zetaproteobacteria bacterium]|nr:hypothetical protein [Zetaproteobacteria bacterium]